MEEKELRFKRLETEIHWMEEHFASYLVYSKDGRDKLAQQAINYFADAAMQARKHLEKLKNG